MISESTQIVEQALKMNIFKMNDAFEMFISKQFAINESKNISIII